jgi:CheY-like chemotaxis protein
VADTGQGMDEETLGRAMEPFFTTKGVGKGTGLGLAMVHGLAAQSGGCLRLKSAPGGGTTVELWLPQADDADVRQVIVVGAGPHEEEDIPPLLVLAVDDDSLVLLNTVAMLEDLGHRVFPAISGKDALALLRRQSVDLVITDYAMPQMTGLQLAQAIKQKHSGLPILLATGYADLPPDADRSLARLAKPFLQKDLAQALREVMGEPSAAQIG